MGEQDRPDRRTRAMAAVAVAVFMGVIACASPVTPSSEPVAVTPTPTVAEVVNGWPGTSRNPPGLYSWGDRRCASASCVVGFMHNGYGSGDVDIRLDVAFRRPAGPPGAAVIVAGHLGTYRRLNAGHEQWIVDIEGTTITIALRTRSGASAADLADAHGIIESMRAEPWDNDRGFRIVFALTTDDWDSG